MPVSAPYPSLRAKSAADAAAQPPRTIAAHIANIFGAPWRDHSTPPTIAPKPEPTPPYSAAKTDWVG
jgi:hypothetical protein